MIDYERLQTISEIRNLINMLGMLNISGRTCRILRDMSEDYLAQEVAALQVGVGVVVGVEQSPEQRLLELAKMLKELGVKV